MVTHNEILPFACNRKAATQSTAAALGLACNYNMQHDTLRQAGQHNSRHR